MPCGWAVVTGELLLSMGQQGLLLRGSLVEIQAAASLRVYELYWWSKIDDFGVNQDMAVRLSHSEKTGSEWGSSPSSFSRVSKRGIKSTLSVMCSSSSRGGEKELCGGEISKNTMKKEEIPP